MIRTLHNEDINEVANIWLNSNIQAHDFIPSQYWHDQYEMVKEEISKVEVYVYEDNNKILGFVGLNEDYLAGIFICQNVQSKGIGKQLIDFVKGMKEQINLSVYQKNERAIKFYLREGFDIQSENVDHYTNEKEYIMTWRK